MWTLSKALQVPLDPNIKELRDTPYTISYVIKKRQQIDNLSQIPKEKRPPEHMVWDSPPEKIEEWLDKVFKRKSEQHTTTVEILESEIE